MSKEELSGSRFIVDLGEVKLPDLVERQVEAEIQAIVLRELAESDYGQSQRARVKPIDIWDQFPGQTKGLWLGDFGMPPIFGFGEPTPLTARDHTLIMSEIMDHPLEVLRHLPARYKSRTGERPSGEEVLKAALQVEPIDHSVKDRIAKVLELVPRFEEGQTDLPESVKKSVDDLRQQLTNKTTVEEKRSVLRDSRLRARHRDDGLAEGMEMAAQIMEDGQDSIYSPGHSFYKMFPGGRGATARFGLGGVADADGVGAVVGGVWGSLAAGVGAAPGAVVGGASASAGAALSDVIDWFSDLF